MPEISRQEEPIEESSLWEQRREAMLANFDLRVECAVDLQRIIEGVSVKDSYKKVSAQLDECWKRQLGHFSPEMPVIFEKHKQNVKNLAELNERCDEIAEKYRDEEGDIDLSRIGEKDDAQFEEIESQIDILYKEIEPLEDDLNIKFLLKLDKIIRSLKEKNKYIKRTLAKGGKKQLVADFLKRGRSSEYLSEQGLALGDIDRVEVNPFDVIFDVNKKHPMGYWGLQHGNSPFISVYNGEAENRDFILKHERLHNVLDPIELEEGSGLKSLEYSYAVYTRLRDTNSPRVILENQIKALRRKKASDFIDENHEEIVAGIEHAYDIDFKGGVTRSERLLLNIFGGYKDKFKATARSLTTAGRRIMDAEKRIRSMAESEEDVEIKTIFEELSKNLRDELTKMADIIKEAVDMAKKIGPEAEEKLDILFIMLEPSKYRHIKSYLENKYVYKL